MKKLLMLLVAAMMVLSLSACSGNKPSDEGTDEVGGGSLVIYSPNSDALVEVAETFGEKYGIEVDIQSMRTGECTERIASEAQNPQADIMYGGVNYAVALNYADYFEPYVAKGDELLEEAYQNTNGVATHYCLDGSGALLINEKVFRDLGLDPDEFKGYEDLLWPELKGHIAMGDPTASASSWAELTNMLLVMGDEPYDEKAWEFVGKFIDQISGIVGSSSTIYKGTVDGEYAVGVSYEDGCMSMLVSGAKDVRLVYPEEGAVWLPAGVAIVKGAPNMDNAKLFVDWLISDEGQNEIAKTTARPVNTAISNTTDLMPPFSEINVAYEDMALCGMQKEAWQGRWTEMFNAAHPE